VRGLVERMLDNICEIRVCTGMHWPRYYFVMRMISKYILSTIVQSVLLSWPSMSLVVQYLSGCIERVVRSDLINSVFVTVDRLLFLQQTDATGKTKGEQFLADDLEAVIMKVGPKNVAGIVLDGPNVCIAAMRALKQKFPHIQMQRCATHAYNLIGKNISWVSFVRDVLQGTAATAGWIGSHTFVREELKIWGGKALMQPAETRFLGLFLASIAVGEDRTAVSVTLNSAAVRDWARKQPKPAKTKRKKPEDKDEEKVDEAPTGESRHWMCWSLLFKYVGNHLWWKKVEALKGVVMPIVCSMRITDTQSPNLHLAAKAYHKIIMDVLEKRKKDCVSWPACAVAAANPKYFYGKDFELWEEGKDTLAMQSVVGNTTAMWLMTANAKLML